MSATLRDVADAVGTSITTVSKVLSGKAIRVSEAKRREILDTAERLKYIPTIAGVNLKKGCTDAVAVIVGDLLYPYYAKFLKELSGLIHGYGKSIIVCDIDNDYELEAEHYQRLCTGYVDGAIILPAPGTLSPEHVKMSEHFWERADLPALILYGDGGQIFQNHSTVGADVFQRGYLAGEHLARLGHRRIAYASSIPAGAEGFDLALNGFRRALEDNGVAYDPALTLWGCTRYIGGREAFHRLEQTDATAVVCSNDMVAIGFSSTAAEAGRRVPGDYSVIGMDDIMATQLYTPKITTISQDVNQVALCAVETFFDDIKARKRGQRIPVRHVTFPPRLVIRGSTAPMEP